MDSIGAMLDFLTTQATGTAERDTVPVLVEQAKERGYHPKTFRGDKGYDCKSASWGCRATVARPVPPCVTAGGIRHRPPGELETPGQVGPTQPVGPGAEGRRVWVHYRLGRCRFLPPPMKVGIGY